MLYRLSYAVQIKSTMTSISHLLLFFEGVHFILCSCSNCAHCKIQAYYIIIIYYAAQAISRGTPFPIVEKLLEHVWTAFSLLKCLRTIFRQKCTILPDFTYNLNFFGIISPYPQQTRSRCLDPDTIFFRLARQRSRCSDFTKRPLIYCIAWIKIHEKRYCLPLTIIFFFPIYLQQ